MTDLQEVSLFSGIGGISLGLERAGVRTALLCEYDKHARKILQRHYLEATIHNDVTELTADDCRAAGAVPGRTVLTAGWPCQGNSVAGTRGGMDDPRSGLWSHVVRLLADLRPAWFIGENVPGLLSVNDGRDFSIVVHDLARLGYGFCWRILDARHFGVPQRRRRVVIVGRLGDTGAAAAQVLLEPEGVPGDPAQGIEPGPRTSRHAREGVEVGGWARRHAATLTAGSHAPGVSAPGRRHEDDQNLIVGPHATTLTASPGGRYEEIANLVTGVLGNHSHTLTAEGHDASEDGTGRGSPVIAYTAHEVSTLQAAGGERGYRIDAEAAAGGHLVAFAENQRGELTASDTLPSLKVRGGKPGQGYPAVTDGVIVRRLTPLECERLQGFPDGWTEGQADSHRSKQLGNSVAVPVFEWVGRRLAAVDNQLGAVA